MGLVWFSQELNQKTWFEIKHSTQSQPESRYYKSRGTLNLNQSVERVLQVFTQEAVCATELYGCGKEKGYVLQQWKKNGNGKNDCFLWKHPVRSWTEL